MNKTYTILIINFITMSTFNLAHPVTPRLINELSLPSFMFGVLFSFMAIANYIMSPIWGSLSDYKGRKKFLIIGVLGYGISQLGFGISQNTTSILFFRLLAGGLAVSFITSSIAYLTDLTDDKNRVKFISFHTATMALGSSVGSFIGGIIGQNNYKYSFIAQFVLCLLIAVIIKLVIRDNKFCKEGKIKISFGHLKLQNNLLSFKSTLSSMMMVITLLTITTTMYNSTISYYVESVLKLPTSVNGLIMSIAGVVALCMNVFINPYIAKKFDLNKTIMTMFFITGISMVLASMASNLVTSAIFLLLFIIGSSLAIPMYQSIIVKMSDNNYGEIMGMQNSAKALGMIIGSLGAGFIFTIGEKLPFLVGGISSLIGLIILIKMFIKKNECCRA